ncbi:hypothetical protein [Streptomyces sp. NRRL S-237]|uniref:hypothetical protein n=1 Tax=Streptomyces sp. NRRL S-237 TaxID=1463895 RepID=UPI0004C4F168|nr:hypothetical protein [Streptomyces sp. NRRL S-237]
MTIPARSAGRYPNAVRDVLDREALRSIHEGGTDTEQLARMQGTVRTKIKVLSPEYRPVFDRAVKSLCTTSFHKVRKELLLAALAGPATPIPTGAPTEIPGCGTGTPDPASTPVPGPRAVGTDDEQVVAKVLIGEGGEITEKTARQLIIEDTDRIFEVLPPLAERCYMEADRLDRVAKEASEEGKAQRNRGTRILALVKRYDRLVVGIDTLPGIFTLADYVAEVGPENLGLDEDDAELIRYASAL